MVSQSADRNELWLSKAICSSVQLRAQRAGFSEPAPRSMGARAVYVTLRQRLAAQPLNGKVWFVCANPIGCFRCRRMGRPITLATLSRASFGQRTSQLAVGVKFTHWPKAAAKTANGRLATAAT
jgi:hypothetical protein